MSTSPATTYPATDSVNDEWRATSQQSADNAPSDSRFSLTRGRERGVLAALLAGTAALYLWGLGASGMGNDFYAAAVQAGTKSWKAMLFGSFDSSNFITVDKPPASLWPMELSGRLFGFSSWSMLAPQAIMGVLAVWLLYATVKRCAGPGAGLLAGALLAITPVAVLMFRFNNPDALMTLLMVLAAYCLIRALDGASTTWLLCTGFAMGFAFLAKGLQPFTLLPALAVVYLIAAPASLKRRMLQLLAAGGALVAGAGWWLLVVALTPASSRPYIGGSGDNTALGLAFGYNGLSRLTGGSGAGGGSNFSGSSGVSRLFNAINGGQVAWLLPAALLGTLTLLMITGRASRTDRIRAAAILFGGWLIVTATVLSFAGGIIHSYYDVELVPAIAAVVAISASVLWRRRAEIGARVALGAGVVVTGWWNILLLDRTSDWSGWVRVLVLVATVVGALALLVPARRVRHAGLVAAIAGLVAVGAGSAAYAVDTAATPHTGSLPSAGPLVSSRGAIFGPTSRAALHGAVDGAVGGQPPVGFTPGKLPTRLTPGGGGFGGNGIVSTALVNLLKNTSSTWAAATVGSQAAAPLELQSGKAVMAIGGFSGGDAAPTLAQFRRYVADGKVRYFIGAGDFGGGGGGGRGGGNSAISTWVQSYFTAVTVGGSTVYDLTKPS